ncbi:MAG: ferredoxin reductase [Pyrinomonadaceae bacterium]|nr:ferredoxin reductase [Pyrinomonadaceae bacterium]
MQTLIWQFGTVVDKLQETSRTQSIAIDVPDWAGHKAGQHIDVRLTAEDGYQAQRSYSIASPPEEPRVWITVERLDDGEVSSYFTDELRTGDRIELRGPVGGYFTWDAQTADSPLMLVAGGSGVVPLMAMIRHRSAAASRPPARLLYSSRSHEDIIYRAEIDRLVAVDSTLEVFHTLTRQQPDGWTGFSRRIDRAMLEEVAWRSEERPDIFVCGPTQFVEVTATSLLELGHAPGRIKTERFGPTG